MQAADRAQAAWEGQTYANQVIYINDLSAASRDFPLEKRLLL